MSDPVIRRVRRSVEESTNSGGMLVGMPKVTIDAGDASRLCLLAEKLLTQDSELTRLQSEVEMLRGQLADMTGCACDAESLCKYHAMTTASGRSIILRKQADAVEFAASEARTHLIECAWPQSGLPDDASLVLEEVEGHAGRLRDEADEAEKAGG